MENRKAVIRPDGTIEAVYSDKWREFLEGLGAIVGIPKRTDVDFDQKSGEWRGTFRETGQEIARSRSREECIQQEVEWLEREVIK